MGDMALMKKKNACVGFWTIIIFALFQATLSGQVGNEKRDTPDPDIFDGTAYEKWERENQESPFARIGETSYGNALEGKENQVREWVNERARNPNGEQQDPNQEGSGSMAGPGSGEEESENRQGAGGGTDGESQMIEVEKPELSGQGPPPGEEEGKKGSGGGGGSRSMAGAGEQRGGRGSGMNNPLEMLKKITMAARGGGESEDQSAESRGSGEGQSEEDASFGNNPYQIDKEVQSEDVLGTARKEETEEGDQKASSARESATGPQERSRGGAGDTGDDLPSGI